nr:hypothetical protein [Candidatus Sigynarchaeum springense]
MTETANQEQGTVDGLPVDTGTKYPLDAGRCESCGNYKTWKFKVQNKKTGRMMPGHVTADGFKIGDGDCPKWAKIAYMNKKSEEKKPIAGGAPSVPPQAGAWIRGVASETVVTSSTNSPALASSAPLATMPAEKMNVMLGPLVPAQARATRNNTEMGHVVAFMVNGITITTTVADALAAVEQIGAAIRKILGAGA